jgi:phosphoribulokinase
MGQALEVFYTTYLKYALARRICTEYDIAIPPPVVDQLKIYQQYISKNSARLDLNMSKISTFDTDNAINYAQANLGRGWTT